MAEHNIYLDASRSFLVVNDCPLSMEPITRGDLIPVVIDPKLPYASWAWSAGIAWYFIIGPDWIALFHVECSTGLLSRKKSADMVRAFLDDRDLLRGVTVAAVEKALGGE